MQFGIPWEILKPFAMKLVIPFDHVIIDLDQEDQKKLSDLIKLQESSGEIDAELGR